MCMSGCTWWSQRVLPLHFTLRIAIRTILKHSKSNCFPNCEKLGYQKDVFSNGCLPCLSSNRKTPSLTPLCKQNIAVSDCLKHSHVAVRSFNSTKSVTNQRSCKT